MEIRSVQVGAACSPSKVAMGLSAHLKHWLDRDSRAQEMFRSRQHTFDPRFQRHSLDSNAKTAAARRFDEVMRKQRGLMSTSYSAFEKQRAGELALQPEERKVPSRSGSGRGHGHGQSGRSSRNSASVESHAQGRDADTTPMGAKEEVLRRLHREEMEGKQAVVPDRLLVAPLRFDAAQVQREHTARARAARQEEK